MKANYVVYMHKNKNNNKVYIGQTKCLEQRWSYNGYYYQTSPKFYNAIQKYGWNNFEHIILKKNLDKEQANYWEKYYIQLYRSTENDFGYNMTEGGEGSTPSKDTLNKMSIAQKNRYAKMSEKQRDDIRNHCISINKQYLKNITKEELLKNSKPGRDAAKKYWDLHPEELRKNLEKARDKAIQKTSKKVMCIETKQCYPSSQEAARYLGKTDGSPIRRSCRNDGKSKGYGFHWIFI